VSRFVACVYTVMSTGALKLFGGPTVAPRYDREANDNK